MPFLKGPYKKTYVLVITGIALSFFAFAGWTQAGSTDHLFGWAWSENIGWVSFNCTNENTCDSVDYGTDIENSGDRAFSGQAWSENIGWISFERSETGAPPEADPVNNGNCDNCIAWLDTSADPTEARGWARALAGADDPGDGWDGWIRLDSDAGGYEGVNLNKNPDPDEFEGWAWGDEVVGWISLNSNNIGNGNDYSVNYNREPEVVSIDDVSFSKGAVPQCLSYELIEWTYEDEENDPQSAYRVQADTNSDFSSPEYDSGKVNSSAKQHRTQVTTAASGLNFNTNYYWRVKVWDELDGDSDWKEYDNNPDRTSLHPYTGADFSWEPPGPFAREESVDFTHESTEPEKDVDINYHWTFEDGNPATSNDRHPEGIIFEEQGDKEVLLEVYDPTLDSDPESGNGECNYAQNVDVQLPPPEYREVPPTSFLERTFSVMHSALNFAIGYLNSLFV